jgi:nitrite reductase/ring-hydroxylating ferredoxin subunit
VEIVTPQDEQALRERWVPGIPAQDLPGPGSSPRSLGLFGEELIAFRQPDGTIGVIDGTCPHEGAPMHDGRIHQGARCSLHGWEFDALGRRCDPYPVSRGESVAAYRSRLSGGLVWVFLGSGVAPEPPSGPSEAASRWNLRAFPAGLAAAGAAIRAIGGLPAQHEWPLAFALPVAEQDFEACTLLLVPKDATRTSVLCGPVCRDEDMIAISRALAAG